MTYQMAATAVTLNDLEGHSPVVHAMCRTFMQHFALFAVLTVYSHQHGSSALAELLVFFCKTYFGT